jgi:formate dehydrogenase major subunit
MIRASINGHEGEFADGTTILTAARLLGIEVPTLCHDDRIKPAGACRLCNVSIDGLTQQKASCSTLLTGGMSVQTHTPEVEDARRWNLRMLAKDYPVSAFRSQPDIPLHKLARQYGLIDDDFAADVNGSRIDDSHTYIRVDMSRCINCYACVRICDEVQGQFVWQIAGRCDDIYIVPDSYGAFGDSTCVSCGACSDVCPSGAIQDKSILDGFPTSWTKTTCPYCGTGCEMEVGVLDDKVIQVRPAKDAPVNNGHLCVKGRYAFGFIDAADRVTSPMIKENGDWREVSWEEALKFTANKMSSIIAENGSDSVAILGSARATNEENYLAQKFARVVAGTNNVDCCARVCHTPTAAAMKMMIGTGAATNSFVDIEMARTIMLCGTNTTENHPIPGARIKQAVLKGANLIVIDPRKTELTKIADVHLQLRPGTNIDVFNAIAHAIVDEGLVDQEFMRERVTEFDEFREFVADYAPEKVGPECGVPAELIRKAARIYASAKPSMAFHGLGMTEHTQGTEGVMTIVNLALLTGNLGNRGGGVNPLRGQNNVQGSAHMGCDPGILTGSAAIESVRQLFERVWKTSIPTTDGLNQLKMIDAAKDGRLKALWAIGYDVFFSNANAHETEASLKNLELCIVQDLFFNETAQKFANVFLPAVSSFEKDGTFMNSERRIQRVRKAVEPRGDAKSDWEIICALAQAMGHGKHFQFETPEEIWNEVREVWPAGAGISYERIERAGIQWPCPDESHPGTEVLHGDSFNGSKTAALRRIKYRPTKEVVSDKFPLLLTTGRTLCQFNAGTMTMRTPNIELYPTDFLMISPDDANDLKLSDGETVQMSSAYGRAMLPVHITRQVRRGELFATFHDTSVFLNFATSKYRDRFTQAPEFKVTAVRIDKLD